METYVERAADVTCERAGVNVGNALGVRLATRPIYSTAS